MPWFRRLTLFLALGCLMIFVGSYAAEVWGGMSACILCHVERFFFLGAGVIAGIAYFLPEKGLRVTLKVLAVLWFAGSGVALYHTAVQQHWVSLPRFCAVHEPQGETLEEIAENLLNTRHASCDQVTFSLFGIPMPVYLIFVMAGLGLGCWYMGDIAAFLSRATQKP